jgi:hypothetical protein
MVAPVAIRIARVFTAALALVPLVLPLVGAAPAQAVAQGPYTLEVLVDGRPLAELYGHGRRYVEAFPDREYSLRLTNNTGRRVGIAVSVDGLNSIDARTTTAKAGSKWILGPYESIVLDGWQTSSALARRFYFTTEKSSYGAWLGKTANLGVIAAVVFRERLPETDQPMHFRGRGKAAIPEGRAEGREPSGAAPPPMPEPAEPGRADAGAQALPEGGFQAPPSDDYAATGIGREVDHQIERVRFDAERSAAACLEIRYEYRPALVKLGLLPRVRPSDPLERREHARGFEPGFAPDPYRPDGRR